MCSWHNRMGGDQESSHANLAVVDTTSDRIPVNKSHMDTVRMIERNRSLVCGRKASTANGGKPR